MLQEYQFQLSLLMFLGWNLIKIASNFTCEDVDQLTCLRSRQDSDRSRERVKKLPCRISQSCSLILFNMAIPVPGCRLCHTRRESVDDGNGGL